MSTKGGTTAPPLDAVKSDDRPMVLDVLRVLQGLKFSSAFTVNLAPRGYEVLGYIHTDSEQVDVSLEDTELVQQVNPLRVKFMGFRVHAAGASPCVRVRIISLSEPCMMDETILFTMRKRARFYEDP
jgi:hypothetical protein